MLQNKNSFAKSRGFANIMGARRSLSRGGVAKSLAARHSKLDSEAKNISRKNFHGEEGKIFAKVMFASLLIFAFSFTAWLNFRGIPADTAKAADDNWTVQKLDYITFDGQAFVNTKIDQIGDTKIVADFQYDDISRTTVLFGSRTGVVTDTLYFSNQLGASNENSILYGGGGWHSTGITADTERHTVTFDATPPNWSLTFDDTTIDGTTATPPSMPREMYLGAGNGPSAGKPIMDTDAIFAGNIFTFQIYKGSCSDADFTDQESCENGGETWSRKLVINLVPAARYFGCGENFVVEYGFANDLDSDNNLANDEWFGNARVDDDGNSVGALSGSEEITATECPAKPSESENPPTEISPVAKPTAKNSVGAPNTGI